MATNKNKTGASGLRILWIPGKKKQHKGVYNPTRKNTSPQVQQKKNEQWSLGGAKGQEELLKAEIPGTEMASPSIINCLPQSLGISAACGDNKPLPEEGKESEKPAANENAPKSDLELAQNNNNNNIHAPGLMIIPRMGSPLANIDEDEHENDFEGTKDDYCGASSNTATLLLKDRKNNKCIIPLFEKGEKDANIDEDDNDDDDLKKKLQDNPDGVPQMRGLNRKQTLERSYRDQAKEGHDMKGADEKSTTSSKNKKKKDTGMNETAVDCLHFGLMCCECSIQ